MTLREEIKQQAEEYRQPYRNGGYRLSSKDVRDAFEEGAEWMHKTMIEKACQWIESYLFDIGFPDDWCSGSATMKRGKQRFLEAMEE